METLKQNLRHIVISRVDNIGDVLFALPLAGVLKSYFPDCKITFIAKAYTQDLIQSYAYVDECICLESLTQISFETAVNKLKAQQIDAFIHVYPHKLLARLAKKAEIPYRIGTGHRWYHWLYCNHPVFFSRRKSKLHESQLNLKLLAPLGINAPLSLEQIRQYFKFHFSKAEDLPALSLLDQNRINLIIHPGSNGNGREWPTLAFRTLIQSLPADRFKIFITGTAKEQEVFHSSLIEACPQVTSLMGKLTLQELMRFIAAADGILASGTGPLHLGAALGIHALGLFPPVIGAHPARWQPLGVKAQYLVHADSCDVKKCSNTTCICMANISVQQVQNILLTWNRGC